MAEKAGQDASQQELRAGETASLHGGGVEVSAQTPGTEGSVEDGDAQERASQCKDAPAVTQTVHVVQGAPTTSEAVSTAATDQEAQQPPEDVPYTSEITDEAVQVALLAGLNLSLGAKFFTMGPQPCAVEYTGVPGERRGRVRTGTEITVLEAKVHTLYDYRYVAARIASTFEDGYGWINLCREETRFVVPTTEARPQDRVTSSRSNNGPY